MRLVLIVLLSLLVFQAVSKPSNCMHDAVPKQQISYPIEDPSEFNTRRVIQNEDWLEFRITYDISKIDDNEFQNYIELKPYINKLLNISTQFFYENLRVLRESGNNKIISEICGSNANGTNYTVPENDRTTGIPNSDLHIYVDFFTSEQNPDFSQTLAFASACQLGILATTRGRPNFGYISYNLDFIGNSNLSNHLEFEDNLETTLHEIIHILGFSSSLFKYWYDNSTSSAYGLNESKIIGSELIRNLNTSILKTPEVIKVAKEHFGCQNLEGVQLENEGAEGTLGSHWETTILFNEIMNPQSVSYYSSISKFTMALLQDSGWYQVVNMDAFDQMTWGRGKGCEFVQNACYSNTSFPEFGNSSTEHSCGFHYEGISKLANDTFTDGCEIYKMYSNTYCQNIEYQEIVQFSYPRPSVLGDDSKCFDSDIISNNSSPDQQFQRCFVYQCDYFQANDTWKLTVNVQIGSKNHPQIFLSTDDQPNQLFGQVRNLSNLDGDLNGTAEKYKGILRAPRNIKYFCEDEQACENFCSSNGYCLKNICHCLEGYQGEDCKIPCPGLYKQDSTSDDPLCVTECDPNQIDINNKCTNCPEGCEGKCERDSSDPNSTRLVCKACKANYFSVEAEPGVCVSVCPDKTYISNTSCKNCHAKCPDCKEIPNYSGEDCSIINCPNYYQQESGKTVVVCVDQCDLDQIPIKKKCTDCPEGCEGICVEDDSSSDNPQPICQSCKSDYFEIDGKQGVCVQECPEKTYAKEQKCLQCHENCPKCNEIKDYAGEDCSKACNDYLTPEGECVEYCPTAHYYQGKLCMKCPADCSRCRINSDTQEVVCVRKLSGNLVNFAVISFIMMICFLII